MWAKNEARNVEAEPPAPRHLSNLPKSKTLFGMMNLDLSQSGANFNMRYTCMRIATGRTGLEFAGTAVLYRSSGSTLHVTIYALAYGTQHQHKIR
jgi:hypothetical protein